MPSDNAATAGAPAAADLTAVEEFLSLLGRTVRQFHTYPATSPLRANAVAACHKSLAGLDFRDRLALRITATDVIVDETRIGAGTIIEQEVARRLNRARVASLEIDRSASVRDLSRFCTDLLSADDFDDTRPLAELLTEHGVDTIVVGLPQRPEVVEVGAPATPTRNLLSHERRRQRELVAPDAPVSYLYPPDKGWVRLDPSDEINTVSLLDLAVLVEDPAEIATVLLRLTGDEAGTGDTATAIERKFSDVTKLFSALDPTLARVMFGRLGNAILELEPGRRKELLQRTILPGLLEGGSSRAVLQDFPDADLADALCMLLDLETAAPEVLSAALNHLDLSLERREAVVSLIDERLRARQGDQAPGSRDAGIDRYAQALITVNASASSNYSDFAAFDLSIGDHATAEVTMVRDGIYTTDVPATQFRCVRHLIHLEPNPTIVQGLLARAQGLFATFEQAGRWQDLARAVVECRQLADEFLERRPDVAEAITLGIAGLCTPAWVRALLDLSGRDADARATVNALIDALGPALVPGVIAVLDDPTQQGWSRALSTILCERAATIAPALEAALTSCGPGAAKTVVRALGYAGPGHEAAVAALIGHRDEQLAREALRALARIATPAAAALVADHIRATSLEDGGAAEEALWHFPAEQAAAQVCRLMLSQDFVVKHPAKVARLLDRASHSGARGLDEGLAALERLWTRFWNPSLVRLALKARELRAR